MQAGGQFFDFNLGHLVEMAGLVIAYFTYRGDRKKDSIDRAEARENMIKSQSAMHSENKQKLEGLSEFQRAQQLLNGRRDEQIAQLTMQTATLTQMASGQERRLQMLENKS